jgi:hypothetical protein
VPPSRTDTASNSLDERIALAELRLVAREARIRDRSRALVARVHGAMQPRQLVWPVLGGVASLLGAWWLRRRVRVSHSQPVQAAASATTPEDALQMKASFPWRRALAVLWAWVPAGWRARVGQNVSPRILSLAFEVGLPLALLLFRRTPRPAR